MKITVISSAASVNSDPIYHGRTQPSGIGGGVEFSS